MGSEESLSRSEMLAGEDGVVRAGKRTPGDQALDFSAAFGPVMFVRDRRRRKSACDSHSDTRPHPRFVTASRSGAYVTHVCTRACVRTQCSDVSGVRIDLSMRLHVHTQTYTQIELHTDV